MLLDKIKIFIQDILWTYSLPPHTPIQGLLAVYRLLVWHFIIKKTSMYQLGTFQSLQFLYDTKSDGAAHAYIIPQDDYRFQLLLDNTLTKGDIFIDIGANVGTETLIALKKQVEVHAFEPTEKTYNNLVINVLLNDFNNSLYNLNNQAVSNKNGNVSFYVQNDISLTNSLIAGINKDDKKITVQSTTLDTYVSKMKIKSIKLLKIDVEGAEEQVFLGAKKVLMNQLAEVIFWEANQQASKNERTKVMNLLSSYNYKHFTLNLITKRLQPWNGEHDCISISGKVVKKYIKRRY